MTLSGLGIILFIGAGARSVDAMPIAQGRKACARLTQRWAAVALLNVALVVGFALSLSSGVNELVFDLPSSLYVALALQLIALLQTATAAVFAGIIWKDHHWSIGGRVFYSLATLRARVPVGVQLPGILLGYRIG